MDATVVLGQQGRIVLPVDVRRALGLAPGDRLSARFEGGAIVLEPLRDPVAALRGLGSTVPRSRSLVDELIAERRAEVRG
jgi:AbrB family looped-hinge helix DNA binding protein